MEAEGVSIGGSHIWNNGYIGVAYSRYESLYGIPGEEAVEARPRIDLEQDKILAKGEWRVGSNTIEALRFWFGASDYKHDEVVSEGGSDEVGNRFTNEEHEARIELEQCASSVLQRHAQGSHGCTFWRPGSARSKFRR